MPTDRQTFLVSENIIPMSALVTWSIFKALDGNLDNSPILTIINSCFDSILNYICISIQYLPNRLRMLFIPEIDLSPLCDESPTQTKILFQIIYKIEFN